MKIGLVRRGYSASGGAEAYLFRFADAARAAGHETVLIHGSDWPADAWRHEQVCVAGRTPEDFADHLAERRESGGWDVLFSLERVWACDVYRAGDGVHAAWLERRRQFDPPWKGWLRFLERKHREIIELETALFTGGARRVIANSQMVKDEIIRHFGTPAEHVHLIRNGVPAMALDAGLRDQSRKELGIPAGELVAFFAGSGWARKGLRHAIEGVSVLKMPVTLLVAGKGETRGLPASKRVKFLGPLPESRMREMFAAADIFVLPTVYDPFSNACLEALAAGLPVITTSANGFSEIMQPGVDGEVIPPGDSKAVSRAIAAWADPRKREAARPGLIEKAAAHSVEQNLSRTLDVITAAVGSTQQGAG
jgi:UDP-glucose:(heptosyl)LPS alpha-1,3-glucosyltransferase